MCRPSLVVCGLEDGLSTRLVVWAMEDAVVDRLCGCEVWKMWFVDRLGGVGYGRCVFVDRLVIMEDVWFVNRLYGRDHKGTIPVLPGHLKAPTAQGLDLIRGSKMLKPRWTFLNIVDKEFILNYQWWFFAQALQVFASYLYSLRVSQNRFVIQCSSMPTAILWTDLASESINDQLLGIPGLYNYTY
ncbi:hypothetical protein AVEN_179408-1 [Araneus ventricosus]|uniref:Uncharacterized protein n=1 Tax=Araneus ventricosus TaxID=182803 RepID=A0A4Y2BG07_ARAVE|nr:hypothetical protein AVEN_179408-1 [Araneus ventricosus]